MKNEEEALVYSSGTFYLEEGAKGKKYTFASATMSSFEGYYKHRNFNLAKTFFRDVALDPIANWKNIYVDDILYEVWILEGEEGYFKDKYTGQIYTE